MLEFYIDEGGKLVKKFTTLPHYPASVLWINGVRVTPAGEAILVYIA